MSKLKRETLMTLVDEIGAYNDAVLKLFKCMEEEKIGKDKPLLLLKQLEVSVHGLNLNEAVSKVLDELSE